MKAKVLFIMLLVLFLSQITNCGAETIILNGDTPDEIISIYENPDQQSHVIGQYYSGIRGEISNISGSAEWDFLMLETRYPIEGYIHRGDVKPYTFAQMSELHEAYVICREGANMLNEPHSEGDLIGTYPELARLIVYGYVNDFAHVRAGQNEGFIHRSLLSDTRLLPFSFSVVPRIGYAIATIPTGTMVDEMLFPSLSSSVLGQYPEQENAIYSLKDKLNEFCLIGHFPGYGVYMERNNFRLVEYDDIIIREEINVSCGRYICGSDIPAGLYTCIIPEACE